MAADVALTGGLVAIGVAVARGIEHLARRWSRPTKRSSEDRVMAELRPISEIVTLRDSDGAPRIYWPTELVEAQREIARSLAVVASAVERTLEVCERMERRLERTEPLFVVAKGT